MDEYENTGMDPAVKQYFRKIMSTFAAGLLWMMVTSSVGFYFGLAKVSAGWQLSNVLFYAFAALSFVLLLRYFFRTWKDLK